MSQPANRINVGKKDGVINAKIGSRQQQNINVSGRPNPHYITTDTFNDYQNYIAEHFVKKTELTEYQQYVSEHFVTIDTFNNTINSLNIPRKLTDLEIDLSLVKYDPNKDYLEVVEQI